MEEKILKMIINYVLGVYEDDKKSIESCIEVNTLFINMMKNEETKLDRLLYDFPKTHPVSVLYSEIFIIETVLTKLVADSLFGIYKTICKYLVSPGLINVLSNDSL